MALPIACISDPNYFKIAREFYLNHELLSKQPNRGDVGQDNKKFFFHDLVHGKLDSYAGSNVLYHKGVFCGQAADGEHLLQSAQRYYGHSNLASFRVPLDIEALIERSLDSKVQDFEPRGKF